MPFRIRGIPIGGAAAILLCLGARPVHAQQATTPDVSRELQVARQVLATPEMQKAIAFVERSRDETVQEWLSLCNAYGISGDETVRSRLIYKLFRIYGLEQVRIDYLRNVIGVRRGTRGRLAGGDAPTTVLNAHHDVVALWPSTQPIEAFVADDRIWCPSAGDDLMGVVQVLGVARAMNAGNIQTQGDVWFTTFTGEEPAREYASPGSEYFVRSMVPHNIDWKRGDVIIQFHGGGGGGVSTGSIVATRRSLLRLFVPIQSNRWGADAMDALAPLLTRLLALQDPRAAVGGEGGGRYQNADSAVLYMNFPMIEASEIVNAPAREVRIRFDLRSDFESRLQRADRDIQRVAAEVTRQIGPDFSYVYEINNSGGLGLDVPGITGWDKMNNAPARMAAAASVALYGGEAVIDPFGSCGDCRRAYKNGMPMLSFRGDVIDHGGGRFEHGRIPLRSESRKISSGHDVTESAPIDAVWAGMKHGLLFAVSYAGMAR